MIAPWSANEAELGAGFQRLIPTGEQSGLQTHIATMESVEKLTAFMELESAIISQNLAQAA
jgi:hypothetical protein